MTEQSGVLKCSEQCGPEDDGPEIQTQRGTICFKKANCTSITAEEFVDFEVFQSHLWQCTLSKSGEKYTKECNFYDKNDQCMDTCSGDTVQFSNTKGKLCLHTCTKSSSSATCTHNCEGQYFDPDKFECVK